MKNLTPFARRLRNLRTDINATQAVVADALGIERSYLSKLETSGDMPGRDTLNAIATYYGVTVEFLMSGDIAPLRPVSGEFIEDADELALVRFWRGLSPEAKQLVTSMMQPPR